jgi:hypothetical protein
VCCSSWVCCNDSSRYCVTGYYTVLADHGTALESWVWVARCVMGRTATARVVVNQHEAAACFNRKGCWYSSDCPSEPLCDATQGKSLFWAGHSA